MSIKPAAAQTRAAILDDFFVDDMIISSRIFISAVRILGAASNDAQISHPARFVGLV
ncbi:hypothetical protein CHELA40_13905 [Chelatococcus asaccharovorans]|nr:hypothetical protein CHELA40_13905 [Chelatococcus asaccharovorans]CAH1674822.1 hypothetical protein CHELA17_61723 [Chelatococcus asaccharovorans]